jgi:hypothetical protein
MKRTLAKAVGVSRVKTRYLSSLFNFFPRFCDNCSQINLQSTGNFQNGFQCRISFAVFHVGDHLGGKSGFLSNKVFGKLAALSLLLKKGNDLCAKCLNVSIHPGQLQENDVDSAFHYGEIALNFGRNG